MITVSLHKIQPIQCVSVYFAEDGEKVSVPESWSLEYRCDGVWRAIVPYMTDSYRTDKDHFNVVHPDREIKGDAVRVNMKPGHGCAIGVHEITVE